MRRYGREDGEERRKRGVRKERRTRRYGRGECERTERGKGGSK